jgi:hypothetical protein
MSYPPHIPLPLDGRTYGNLLPHDFETIRIIVREELDILKSGPTLSQVVYQSDSKEQAYIELDLGGETYCGLVTRKGSLY